MNNFFLSVVMITYGHEKYIREAIEGVLMQNCNFEIELIIADDCSPDDTESVVQNIIKSHPKGNIIKYIKHQKNKGMMPNFNFAIKAATGKYIALCEGDDYWIDPLKLQKQVNFLETNIDYIMICHGIKELKNDTLKDVDWRFDKTRLKFRLQDYLYQLFFHTSSVVFRNIELPEYINSTKILNGDYAVFSYILTKGKLYYFNESMSVYRMHLGGVTNSPLHKEGIKVFESKKYIFEHLNAITKFKYNKFIKLNFVIENQILLMNLRKNRYSINRFKYWFYKLQYKFLLLFEK